MVLSIRKAMHGELRVPYTAFYGMVLYSSMASASIFHGAFFDHRLGAAVKGFCSQSCCLGFNPRRVTESIITGGRLRSPQLRSTSYPGDRLSSNGVSKVLREKGTEPLTGSILTSSSSSMSMNGSGSSADSANADLVADHAALVAAKRIKPITKKFLRVISVMKEQRKYEWGWEDAFEEGGLADMLAEVLPHDFGANADLTNGAANSDGADGADLDGVKIAREKAQFKKLQLLEEHCGDFLIGRKEGTFGKRIADPHVLKDQDHQNTFFLPLDFGIPIPENTSIIERRKANLFALRDAYRTALGDRKLSFLLKQENPEFQDADGLGVGDYFTGAPFRVGHAVAFCKVKRRALDRMWKEVSQVVSEARAKTLQEHPGRKVHANRRDRINFANAVLDDVNTRTGLTVMRVRPQVQDTLEEAEGEAYTGDDSTLEIRLTSVVGITDRWLPIDVTIFQQILFSRIMEAQAYAPTGNFFSKTGSYQPLTVKFDIVRSTETEEILHFYSDEATFAKILNHWGNLLKLFEKTQTGLSTVLIHRAIRDATVKGIQCEGKGKVTVKGNTVKESNISANTSPPLQDQQPLLPVILERGLRLRKNLRQAADKILDRGDSRPKDMVADGKTQAQIWLQMVKIMIDEGESFYFYE